MALTKERARYEAVRRHQASMNQVSDLLDEEALRLLDVASGFGQQEMGGYLRLIVPGLLDRWGNVNATVAVRYYDEQRLAWLERHPGGVRSQNGRNRMAERYARARLQGELYAATIPAFDAAAIAEPVIGYGMSSFLGEGGFDSMREAIRAATNRAVGSYNRDTMLYNAGLDSAVIGVQRVAEPKACEFCRTLAFKSQKQTMRADGNYYLADNVRVADYAIHFHNNCHCSIETLYAGDEPIVPDYYKDFEFGKNSL